MSTPYDLDPQGPQKGPESTQDTGDKPLSADELFGRPAPAPAPRASDILREHIAQQDQPRRISNVNGGERAATKADEPARAIFILALLVVVGSLGYLLYGLWGGMLADPNYTHHLTHADHARILANIDTMALVLKVSLFVALIALLFLFYHEETSGYILLAVALFFSLGIPLITQKVLDTSHSVPSHMTRLTIEMIQSLAWLPGIPGGLLIIYDIFRRIAGGLEDAQIRRATLRYGQGVARQAKHHNVFLGPCWNTPFCRDAIRAKCPIYINKKGPCWRNKRGCMCEESIILQAQSGDWKTRVAGAVSQMEGSGNPTSRLLNSAPKAQVLSTEQKKERCRQCVIYNKHQEQKYKALVVATFVFVFGFVALVQSHLVQIIQTGCNYANAIMGRFSYNSAGAGAQPGGVVIDPTAGGPLTWIILGVVTLIILSKLLQLVEYCCFKIKV